MKKKKSFTERVIMIMALALYGAGLEDLSGSINGWTFARNKGGTYVRYKASPTQPRTSFQVNVRGLLTGFSQAWRSLTEPQRQGWRDLAKTLPYTNVFGQSKFISGNSLFNKFNINLTNMGAGTTDDAPVMGSPDTITSLAVTADSGTPTLSAALTYGRATGGDDAVLVFATPCFSPGRTFVKNQFRFIQAFNGTPGATLNILTAWEARFGTLVAGQNVAVRVVPGLNTTGQLGLGQEDIVSIT